ncbi:MAG TPA: polysaccharide deacetylase family protein [Candidatus Saccharimonadia bacterium]|jgi:peptidoglycan/xylan/chitin deacetylase (PgdA/CDA1 family)
MRKKTKKRSRSVFSRYKKDFGLFLLADLLVQKIANYKKELALVLIAEVVLAGGIILTAPWRATSVAADISDSGSLKVVSSSVLNDYFAQRKAVGHFEDAETTDGIKVVADAEVQSQITAITIDLDQLSYKSAHEDLLKLKKSISDWNAMLQTAVADHQKAQAAAAAAQTALLPAAPPVNTYLNVPILLYHYTPGDFEAQLEALREKGYNAISMDQLTAALNKQSSLPSKPVVITFDDGYENQMTAYALLQKYQMPAIFYIIDGGQASNWCIGAGRQYQLSSQPPTGCGDQYLTWDQLRQIDSGGLVTIGSHTVDHINLASLPADQQWFEIEQGKLQLEAQLGHAVNHFAYPYGGYNSTTVALVRQAGFSSAVTTLPGTYQGFGGQYVLRRVRSAYVLP